MPLAPATPPRLFRRPLKRDAVASRVAYQAMQGCNGWLLVADGLSLPLCEKRFKITVVQVLFQTRPKKRKHSPLRYHRCKHLYKPVLSFNKTPSKIIIALVQCPLAFHSPFSGAKLADDKLSANLGPNAPMRSREFFDPKLLTGANLQLFASKWAVKLQGKLRE